MTTIEEKLRACVDEEGWITEPEALQAATQDVRGLFQGQALALLRPANTAQVAAIVRLCLQEKLSIVPQGGNTGYVGGAIPNGERQVIVSLARMNQILEVDAQNNTLTLEAGCILADAQQAAQTAERLLPLGLSTHKRCQIGGNLSTNAGGTSVLRYGNTRDLVLGLEVVLGNGEVWSNLRGLRKDNSGYDLKHLFVGAEGTLGIITAAVLKLSPQPLSTATALFAPKDVGCAIKLLNFLQEISDQRLDAFEYIQGECLQAVKQFYPGLVAPFSCDCPHYVLAELSSGQTHADLSGLLRWARAEFYDGLEAFQIAGDEQQARYFWQLRAAIPRAQNQLGFSLKHDIALPISRIPEFLQDTQAAIENTLPGVQIAAFGHLGDGNLHYNLLPSSTINDQILQSYSDTLSQLVHDRCMALQGSFSAEHGIGQLKKNQWQQYKSPIEQSLSRTLKTALDPQGVFNPNKVLADLP